MPDHADYNIAIIPRVYIENQTGMSQFCRKSMQCVNLDARAIDKKSS